MNAHITENNTPAIPAATIARTVVLALALVNQLLSAAGKPVRAVFAPDTCTGNQQGKSKQAAGWSKSKRHHLHHDVQV